ncbi:MAG TPA: DNA primase [Candidatus Doudnabacteria bacterium]|nr:DNA primase [Candidatus Doudnabacteria bacterium]
MSDNTIQDIKDKLDIGDVIGRYVQLKKSGANLKGLCPFHSEKTGSFMVSPQKQIWHCFGCGEGGDVIGFLKRYENLEFREALEMAAELAGVELPQYRSSGPAKSEVEELVRINEFTASFFQKALTSSPVAQKYLQERELSPQTIERWRIGFAPDSFDALSSALKAKNVSLEQAVKAGVLAKSENGKVFDRFRGRITFPIFDARGQVVAFTARTLPGAPDNQAKYVNSQETPLYNKSKIVFGLNFAKDAFRELGQAVIVEGQMDVISAHQSGFKNTVATSGTALTEDQLKILKRFVNTIVFAFDNDEAGRRALLRAAHLALKLDLEFRVVNLESAKDPDEVIRKHPSLWDKLIANSLRGIEYYIEQARLQFLFGSLEQKQYLTDTVLPLVVQLQNPVEADHYIQKISNEFVISESALKRAAADAQIGTTAHEIKPIAIPIAQESIWEREILGGMIVFPDFLEFVKIEGLPEALLSAELSPYFQKVILGQNLAGITDPLVTESIFMVESNLENLDHNELALVRELKKSFFQFKLAKLKHYLQELTVAIKKAEQEKNTELAKQLGGKFAQLSSTRFEIETKLREA